MFRYSRETPCTLYNWKKYVKYAHYDIGGYNLSLLDLMCIIIKADKINDLPSNFVRNEFKNKEIEALFEVPEVQLVNLCLTIPST